MAGTNWLNRLSVNLCLESSYMYMCRSMQVSHASSAAIACSPSFWTSWLQHMLGHYYVSFSSSIFSGMPEGGWVLHWRVK